MSETFKKSGSVADSEILTPFEERLSKAFAHKKGASDHEALFALLAIRIEKAEKARKLQRRITLLAVCVAAIAASVFSWTLFRAEVASSGFAVLAWLAFSDTVTVLGDWRSFTLSLLEALPAMSLLGLLGGSWLSILFLKYFFESLESPPFLITHHKHI